MSNQSTPKPQRVKIKWKIKGGKYRAACPCGRYSTYGDTYEDLQALMMAHAKRARDHNWSVVVWEPQ